MGRPKRSAVDVIVDAFRSMTEAERTDTIRTLQLIIRFAQPEKPAVAKVEPKTRFKEQS